MAIFVTPATTSVLVVAAVTNSVLLLVVIALLLILQHRQRLRYRAAIRHAAGARATPTAEQVTSNATTQLPSFSQRNHSRTQRSAAQRELASPQAHVFVPRLLLGETTISTARAR